MSNAMETDPSRESEIYMVTSNESGYGLPYAPENFPEAGDKWGWKVGKRVSLSGYFLDRYLYLPARLHDIYKSGGFASKKAVERFMVGAFPTADINAFFTSFTWKIPAEKVQGKKETVSVHPNSTPNIVPAGCKAGNITCSSLLKPRSDLSHSDCDICCSEPLFCGDCCCILCCLSIDSDNKSFIRCEAKVKDGLICGHICHIECALRSYMAGTVGGKISLDAEYYCRRCDARTDLIPHVVNLFESCKSIDSGDKIQKILHICVLILQGSTKPRAKTLLHRVQSAVRKLMEGKSLEDIWKPEETSADTTENDIPRQNRSPRFCRFPRQDMANVEEESVGRPKVLLCIAHSSSVAGTVQVRLYIPSFNGRKGCFGADRELPALEADFFLPDRLFPDMVS